MNPDPPVTTPPDDPVFLNSRREMFIILSMWGACLLWVVPYCYIMGYGPFEDVPAIPTLFGIPSWVVWGIAAPWLVADVVIIAFCTWVMKDDDLNPQTDPPAVAE